MALHALFEIALHLSSFRNIDMAHQGTYRTRIQVFIPPYVDVPYATVLENPRAERGDCDKPFVEGDSSVQTLGSADVEVSADVNGESTASAGSGYRNCSGSPSASLKTLSVCDAHALSAVPYVNRVLHGRSHRNLLEEQTFGLETSREISGYRTNTSGYTKDSLPTVKPNSSESIKVAAEDGASIDADHHAYISRPFSIKYCDEQVGTIEQFSCREKSDLLKLSLLHSSPYLRSMARQQNETLI